MRWVFSVSLSSFKDRCTNYRNWRRRHSHGLPSLNGHILMWVTVSFGPKKINTTQGEVFPGLKCDAVLPSESLRRSISLLVLPLCLWEWGEALSHVWETRFLQQWTTSPLGSIEYTSVNVSQSPVINLLQHKAFQGNQGHFVCLVCFPMAVQVHSGI